MTDCSGLLGTPGPTGRAWPPVDERGQGSPSAALCTPLTLGLRPPRSVT